MVKKTLKHFNRSTVIFLIMRASSGQKLLLAGLVFGVWGFGFYMGSAYCKCSTLNCSCVRHWCSR